MKRILVTILALIYLFTSVGATIYRHYCMDRLVAWGVGQERHGQDTCPYCGMVKTGNADHCNNQSKGCCHDERQQVKIAKDQKTVDESIKLIKPFFPVSVHTSVAPSSFAIIQSPVIAYLATHAPPKKGKTALFIRNCVFRI